MMAPPLRLVAWTVVTASILSLGAATAKDLYVSPDGDDANDGLAPDPGRAKRTVQSAVDLAGPGDTVWEAPMVATSRIMDGRSKDNANRSIFSGLATRPP